MMVNELGKVIKVGESVARVAMVETIEHFLPECGGLRQMSGMKEVPICELLLFGVGGGRGQGQVLKMYWRIVEQERRNR